MDDVIEVRDLSKSFGDTVAVERISFGVKRGEIFGFLGPNGAGKTTTTRVLTGVIPADSGVVRVLGYDIRLEPVQAKQCFGVVPETSNAYADLTAWQNIMLMGELYGLSGTRTRDRANELLGTVGLLERRDRKVKTFSKGMKQRLILAMALISGPELLFLDEPTSGLDVQSTQMILGLLQEMNRSGTTIFLTTHNMEEANRLCDRVAFIRSGRIVAVGPPEQLKMAVEQVHRIEVSFDREVSGGLLTGLDGITDAKRSGDKWLLMAEDPDTAIGSLVGFSREQGASVVTLHTLAPSLDDVFLQLTGEEKP
jgi:ABC-2 type transport system ATP-binding protein